MPRWILRSWSFHWFLYQPYSSAPQQTVMLCPPCCCRSPDNCTFYHFQIVFLHLVSSTVLLVAYGCFHCHYFCILCLVYSDILLFWLCFLVPPVSLTIDYKVLVIEQVASIKFLLFNLLRLKNYLIISAKTHISDSLFQKQSKRLYFAAIFPSPLWSWFLMCWALSTLTWSVHKNESIIGQIVNDWIQG